MVFKVGQEECCDEVRHSEENPRGAELYWHSVICDNLHLSLNGTEWLKSNKYYLFSEKEGWTVDAGALYDSRATEPWGMFPQAKSNHFPSKIINISFSTTVTAYHTKTLPYSLGITKHCDAEECINEPSLWGDLMHWFIEIEDIELIDTCFEVWEIDNAGSGTASRRITTYSVSDDDKIFYKLETGTDSGGELTELTQGAFITYTTDFFPWGFKNPAHVVFTPPSCLDTDKLECNNHIRLFEMKKDYCDQSLKELLDNAPDNGLKAKITDEPIGGASTRGTLPRDYPIIPTFQDLGGFYEHDLEALDTKIKEDLQQSMTEEEADIFFEKNKGQLRAEETVFPVSMPKTEDDQIEMVVENRMDDFEYHIQIVQGAEERSPSPVSPSPVPVSPSFNVISISPRFCECLEVKFEDNPARENMNGIYKRATDDCDFAVNNTTPSFGTFEKIGNPKHIIRKIALTSTTCQWSLIDLTISGPWPAQNRAVSSFFQAFDCSDCPCPADFDWQAPGNDPTVEVVPCPSPSPSQVPSQVPSESPGAESPSPGAESPAEPSVRPSLSPSPQCHLYRLCLSPSPGSPSPVNREYRVCSVSPSPIPSPEVVSPVAESPVSPESPVASPESPEPSASPVNREYRICSPASPVAESPELESPAASPESPVEVPSPAEGVSPESPAEGVSPESPAEGVSPAISPNVRVYIPCSPIPTSPEPIADTRSPSATPTEDTRSPSAAPAGEDGGSPDPTQDGGSPDPSDPGGGSPGLFGLLRKYMPCIGFTGTAIYTEPNYTDATFIKVGDTCYGPVAFPSDEGQNTSEPSITKFNSCSECAETTSPAPGSSPQFNCDTCDDGTCPDCDCTSDCLTVTISGVDGGKCGDCDDNATRVYSVNVDGVYRVERSGNCSWNASPTGEMTFEYFFDSPCTNGAGEDTQPCGLGILKIGSDTFIDVGNTGFSVFNNTTTESGVCFDDTYTNQLNDCTVNNSIGSISGTVTIKPCCP